MTKLGNILRDEVVDGLRCLILQGPVSPCAYIGIPLDSTLADKDYNEIDLPVHGGLTFGKAGDGDRWPAGLYWYGWDYAHYGDFETHSPMMDGSLWTVDTVWPEVIEAAHAMNDLLKVTP